MEVWLADKTSIHGSAGCTGPGPSEANKWRGSECSWSGWSLSTVLEEIACLPVFNKEETDPFCKMMVPHRTSVIEEREREPGFKAHIP